MMEEEKIEKKKGRRISAFNAKKMVASKIGESKLGRSTLGKLMGNDGDAIISALKSAVTKADDRGTAKDLKKDLMKWVLKASVLFQHKDLTRDNTLHLRRPVLMCAERLLEICDKHPAGSRDLSRVAAELQALGPQLKAVLEPHAQDKNVDKVDRLVNYYSNLGFLNKLFNETEFEDERTTILESAKAILLPLPSVLNDEESVNNAAVRSAAIQVELENPTFSLCFDKSHPDFGVHFANYLDSQPDVSLGTALRFLLSEREFAQISAPNLRASRARILCSKYLEREIVATSAHQVGQGPEPLLQPASAAEVPSSVPSTPALSVGSPKVVVPAADFDAIQDAIAEERVAKNAFAAVRAATEARLGDPFALFLSSGRFLNYKQTLRCELDDLRELYGDRVDPPGATGATAAALAAPPSPVPAPQTSSASSE